jgi:hypothetical protein
MKAFRRALRKTPFYGAYKALGHYPDYWYWKLRGEPWRTPHIVKQRAVLEYAERFGLRMLVETGTYYGEMITAVHDRFDRIESVEFDAALAARAQEKFGRWPHVHVVHGDSQAFIERLLPTLQSPALFWLDAGYYGWAGAIGDRDRLVNELRVIVRDGEKRHVILMDDAHGLSGQNGAPTPEQLQSRLAEELRGRAVEVKHNILRITPIKIDS